ncbi:hypothetical protein ANN_22510 [Periplaneta americana]|uniref:Major facilitator superfamily (MFS) profile domain-containing protein n=1 Tax=Periplaneta americana TaxID=6978 RepID=A0ABQ8S9A6_PERAM|nr:hypothetical protein ANN_22510 [Periplaneta americana]
MLVLGSVISALASSYPLLLCGRLMAGFGGALSAVTQCIYAAEVSEAQSRGRAVLLHQLGVATGLLLSSIAGIGDDTQWRMVIWLSAIPAATQGLVALFLPHSPHFKLLQMSQSSQSKQSPSCCAMGNLAETLLLAFGLMFMQQFSGRPTVLYYAPRVFMLVGVCPDAAFTVATIILNIIKVGAVSLSLCVVDKIGRRQCLIVGATCMMTSIALLGMISSMEEGDVDLLFNSNLEPCQSIEMGETVPVLSSAGGFHYTAGVGMASPSLPTGMPPPFPLLPTPVSLVADDTYVGASPWCPESIDSSLSSSMRYLALFALICYEIAYSFGLGPVTWLLLTEVFPASVKGRAVALTTSLHWFADLITPATFSTFVIQTVSSQFTVRLPWLVLLAQSLKFTVSRTQDLQRQSTEFRTQVPQLRSTALELKSSNCVASSWTLGQLRTHTQVELRSRSWLHCYTRLAGLLTKS